MEPTPAKPLTGSGFLAAGIRAAAGSAILGAASTLGDWIWARWLTDGAVLPGVVHGLLFFVLLAGVIALADGSASTLRRLLVALPPLGLLLAAAFYPIALVLGYLPALLVTWVGMWLGVALCLRWAAASREALAGPLGRGILAAVLSGLAFWIVSDLWTNPAGAPPLLGLERFACWTFAFFPGLAALLVGRSA